MPAPAISTSTPDSVMISFSSTSPSTSREDFNSTSGASSSMSFFEAADETDQKDGIAVDRIPIQRKTSRKMRRHRRRLRQHFAEQLNETAPCENGGNFVNGKCECHFPFVGPRCVDFACEHGLSVGNRYDSDSTFFNRMCICDEDWAGELCNEPVADQCNERGQYKNGRCKCHGWYFGPKCQYVGKCDHGKLQEGHCHCDYGYEGDYCHLINCHHGYRDKNNNSESCVCPPRHTGMFCDECLLTSGEDSNGRSYHVLPFPNCTEEVIPHWARMSREKTDDRIWSRLIILLIVIFLLLLLFLIMLLMHWGRRRQQDPEVDVERRKAMEERKELLERAIYLQSARNSTAHPSTSKFELSSTAVGRKLVNALQSSSLNYSGGPRINLSLD
ncbi:teneurin-3 [Ditylenchus destructor]|uniref:Teneurin-3 n=1 Tax=Ditylenchus destructor TaxID=166010 RepID=A0AAD4R4F7_9BILA|nr:teneurin-3 [Ditylenchus destructor]